MRFGLYPNSGRAESLLACRTVVDILKSKGIAYAIRADVAEQFGGEPVLSAEEMACACDVVAVFGGDGTMLNAVAHFASNNVPLLGINLGKIGFLTELDHENIESAFSDAVDRIARGEYRIERRAMLKATCCGQTYYALNEFLLSGTDNCHIVNIRVEIDGTFADKIRCDGVMVATPTGSTAYSLSCGGPVLSPSVRALILNTVCPHSLHSVPMVISDESKVTLIAEHSNVQLTYDGKIAANYPDRVVVELERNAFDASFVRLEKENFYQRLLQKLSYWGE